jgi:hypothetical protein
VTSLQLEALPPTTVESCSKRSFNGLGNGRGSSAAIGDTSGRDLARITLSRCIPAPSLILRRSMSTTAIPAMLSMDDQTLRLRSAKLVSSGSRRIPRLGTAPHGHDAVHLPDVRADIEGSTSERGEAPQDFADG